MNSESRVASIEHRLMSARDYGSLLERYLRPQLTYVIVLATLMLSQIGLQLVNPQIMRRLIDQAQAGAPLGVLTMAAVTFLGIALLIQVLSVFAAYVGERVGWTATNSLRSDLTRHCLQQDMSFHNSRTPGEMIERIDGDASTLGGFFSTFVIELVGNGLMLLGILALLFREEWRAGLALGGFAVLHLIVLSRFRNVAVSHHEASREASADMFGLLEERLTGTEDIRANGAQAYVLRRFYESSRNWYHKQMKAVSVSILLINSNWFMWSIGHAAALSIGAYLFLNDHITIGAVYLIFHYTTMMRVPILQISHQLDGLQKATASIVRIYQLFRITPAVVDGPGLTLRSAAPAVSFDDVSFAYSDAPILRNISFELRPGRSLGLLGRTGSGKTTLTRLLFRLYDPDQGSVRIDGEDIRLATVSDLRKHVGMVTQDVRLFHGTVRDNLTFFDDSVTDERLLRTIDDLELRSWYDSLPDGLDTEMQPDGGGLSAGEAQLLALGRVFLGDARLVILDEASSRIDRDTERVIGHAINRLAEGRTLIIIAHHLATVRRVDEIMILGDGRIVEHGDRQRLAEDPGTRFHRLLRAGMEEVLR